MADRRLDKAEAQLWARVMASVRPLRAGSIETLPPEPAAAMTAPVPARAVADRLSGLPSKNRPDAKSRPLPGTTLDGSWDRQIAKGAVVPDATLDLHGHTLHSAHAMLDEGLARSIGRGDRVLLLVTGRPPRPESERPHARGAIRAAVADWLAASRHAAHIAAVRGAHPRHGGAGALYLVLRRPKRA